MSSATGTPLGVGEYADLVARVGEAIVASVPPGSSVLVVSKGDAALLELPGLEAAHFPQDGSGGYAGHHPSDGATAAGELEALRGGGAEYLAIPETSRWWLGFYEELAQHLAAQAELVADVPGTCLIYGLGRRREAAPAAPVTARPQASPDQIRDYLERLFPAECELLVLEAEDGLAAALAPLRAAALPVGEEAGARGDLLGDLGPGEGPGPRYLVVPRSSDRWLRSNARLEEQLERKLRKIADQRHLCRVFEINRQMEVA
jgi:hypothetical protein